MYSHLKSDEYRLAANGSNAVLKSFDKWTGGPVAPEDVLISYTTHIECMVAFGGPWGWLNDGKEMAGALRTDGNSSRDFSAAEHADCIVVYPKCSLARVSFYRSTPQALANRLARVKLFACDADDLLAAQQNDYD